MKNRRGFTWRGNCLLDFGKSTGISIVIDDKYPTLWRVQERDGFLSDMVNRTRAKDAAQLFAMQQANQRHVHE